MTCYIDGNSIRRGMTSLVRKELLGSKIFTEQDGNFVVEDAQYFEAQEFVQGINSKFEAEVVKRLSDKTYTISIPDSLLEDYIVQTKDGQEASTMVGLNMSFQLSPNSMNKEEMFTSLNYPEVSEMTIDKLKSFLLTLNPAFKVEEIDNLSVKGVSYIKDFLIQVRTLSKFKVVPEEVAHIFRMMLADDNPLKKEMFDNITSFPIYSLTLNKYKNIYVKDGKPDYDKIKWEAADRLVAEYITALATDDKSRLEVLAKPKQNFIQRWFGRFLKWLGLAMRDNTSAYSDIAGIILSGQNTQELKTEDEIANISYTDSYFFNASEEELYNNASDILTNPPPELLRIITDFSKKFGRAFNEILKSDKFSELNEEMKKDGNRVGKINRLIEIKNLLADAKFQMKDVSDAGAFLIGLKQALEAIDRLEMLSTGLLNVIISKEKATKLDEAIKNINELENYMRIQETFVNTISTDLADALVKSGVGRDVVRSILNTRTNFDTVNKYILDRMRGDFVIFFREILSSSQLEAKAKLEERLKRAIETNRPELVKMVKKRIQDLIVSDEQIIAMLSGTGTDVNELSVMNHLLNAAIMNGDPYVASIAKYITDTINKHQQVAKIEVRELYTKIDPIQKALGEIASVTGKFISYVDKKTDSTVEGGTRDVLRYMNPWIGIEVARDKLRGLVDEAYDKYKEVDKNNKEEKEKAEESYKQAREQYQDFLEKYMNRPFIKEYYEFRKKYDSNPLYVEIMEEWNSYTADIIDIEEQLKIEPENDDLWDELATIKRDRSRLLNENEKTGELKSERELQKVKLLKEFFDESSKYKEIDEVQTQLSYSIAENRYIQRVEFAIQDIRKFNFKDIKEVEKRMRELMQNKRIRFADIYNMVAKGEQETDKEYDFTKGINYDFIRDVIVRKWYERNITIVPNEEFIAREKAIITEINELKAAKELSDVELRLAEAYLDRASILQGSKDEINQVNPASLSPEEKEALIELDEEMEELKKSRPPAAVDLEAMTKEDRAKWDELDAIILDPNTKMAKKRDAISRKNKLKNKYKNAGKGKTINDLWALLGSLSDRIATQYYWSEMETFIPHMSEFIKEAIEVAEDEDEAKSLVQFEKDFVFAIDEQNWEEYDFNITTRGYFTDFIGWLKMSGRLSLYDWFMDNHKKKSVFDPANGKFVTLPYVRSSIYNQRVPTLPEHRKIVYNKRFQRKRVKDEYRTGYNPETGKVELKIGTHITNRETVNGYPEFLPLSPEQGEPADSPYRNKAYYDLKNAKDSKSKLRFQYLQTLVDSHIKSQERIPSHLRSWMDVPVMSLSSIEEVKNAPTAVSQQISKIKSIFTKSDSGEAQFEMEGVDTVTNVDTQQVDTENEEGIIIDDKVRKIVNEIPKLGMSQKLPINEVSKDLLKSQAEYTFRSHDFAARSEAQAVPKALNRIMVANSAAYKATDSNKERAKIFEKIYRQMILEEVPGGVLNNAKIRRISSFLTGNTALRMLADLPGATVNYLSAMVNTVIEASAGKYLNMRELGKGKVLAYKVDTALMADFHKKSDLSYYTLLFQDMDFLQGDFAEDLLDRSSSTDKWSSIRQTMMIPRKAGELFVQTAVGMGMMERHKVPNSIDGKSYPMHEIFKKQGDRLVLKEGFPQEYNPLDGEKFHKIKNLINRVNMELHGNYAKISQTEASRYAIGKLAENMKRWFMPAFQRRFGRETIDITFEDLTEGYYRTAGRAAYNYFKAIFQLDFKGAKSVTDFYLKDPNYRANLQRFGADVVQALVLFLVFSLLLGYSGDDKNKELDNNSWIHNMAILVTLRAYSETTAYIPFPPFGFQEMKRNVLSPFALPADAVSNFAAIAQLGVYQVLYWFGADSLEGQLYYKTNSGGYWYTKEGYPKIAKYILRSLGHTGYTFEPAPYIKTFQNLQQRLK